MSTSTSYVELHLHTNYSLLDGASTPDEFIETAADLGYHSLAITDRNNLHGAIEFAHRSRDVGITPIIGVELTVAGSSPLTLLAETRQGYANLCRMVSIALGHDQPDQAGRERRRLDPCFPRERLAEHAAGLICLTRESEPAAVDGLVAAFGRDNLFAELHENLVQGDRARNRALAAAAERAGVRIVGTGDVHYHHRSRHKLYDALTAIRHRTTLDASHQLRRPNSELFLRAPAKQARRFARDWPDAVRATADIAERCASFDLTSDLGYRLPTPPVPDGHDPDSWLGVLCRRQLVERYANEGAERRRQAEERLDTELRLVKQHGLAGFFLVYNQVLELATEVAAQVRAGSARSKAGLPPGRGRGSSVGSIVCYLIGLSHIDPVANNLFLGRFLNEEMAGLPDIDLDFPRDIRDRLFQRVYEYFGPDHAALVATFPRYRIRSAVRDLGKVLGLPASELDRLAKLAEGYGSAKGLRNEMLRAPWFRDRVDAPGWRELVHLAYELDDFPRHVSQHVGGLVIASDPLIDCVPVQPTAWPGRYVCQWDKDAVDDARMVKIDVLALGMLSLVEECLELCAEHRGDVVDLSRIDYDDEAVYARIARGDTIGVFQIESRAQAGILPSTRPANLDDLAAQVAIIRPGPIIGGAVHPFVNRRNHPEVVPEMPHECVRGALEETLGVVLYQEQVVQVAMAMGGFSAGQAEAFRRTMSRRDVQRTMDDYRVQFVAGARARDVPEDVAEQMFKTLSGFASFGFPKSHATAFALLAYQSAWLKEHYPPEFYCALFNNWPMGFYPPHVFTNDARRHGVVVRRPDVNKSEAVCTVEGSSVRLGLGYVRGIGRSTAVAIVGERSRGGAFRSLWDFGQRTGLAREPTENAILVGAFDGFGLGRRRLVWQLGLFDVDPRALRAPDRPRQLQLELPTEQDEVDGDEIGELSAYERMTVDYELLGLSPDSHPMQFLRPSLRARARQHTTRTLVGLPVGASVEVAGLVVCRQRPGTSEGVVFLLLEDEVGLVNVMLFPRLYEHQRITVRTSPFLCIRGVLDAPAGDVAMVRARSLYAVTPSASLRTPDGKSWS